MTLPDPVDEPPFLIPYNGAAAKALELTFRGALRLGHKYVGTEHVLLALLEHEAGTGPLSDLAVDKGAVEDNVVKRTSLLRRASARSSPLRPAEDHAPVWGRSSSRTWLSGAPQMPVRRGGPDARTCQRWRQAERRLRGDRLARCDIPLATCVTVVD